MRAHPNFSGQYLYYRCRARDFVRSCDQKSVRADAIEEQVVNVLTKLKPPDDWRERIVAEMSELLGDQKLEERIAEIKEVIERMDFRWDHGFVTDRDSYLEERVKLQQELEQLSPMADDDVAVAADLLENFEAHWKASGEDREEQKRLVQLIVARVWVRGEEVVAMSLRPDYHITLGLGSKKPAEVLVDPEAGSEAIVARRERRGSTTHVYTLAYLLPTPRCPTVLS
jgi:hypothetical protein